MARSWIREASGRLHEGLYVQGCGGRVRGRDAEARIKLAIDHASSGKPLAIYEPRQGHALGYGRLDAKGLDAVEIDLRGATLERVGADQ